MARFNLEDYETVDSRLKRFYTDYPLGRVHTFLVHRDDRTFIVRTEIYTDREDVRPVSTGYAEEIVGASPVNKTSALENAETSSIGRALGNFIYSGIKKPSREEMEKVQRYEEEPRKSIKPVATPEQLETIGALLTTIEATSDIETLKAIWKDSKELLDMPVNGTTLKDALNERAKGLM